MTRFRRGLRAPTLGLALSVLMVPAMARAEGRRFEKPLPLDEASGSFRMADSIREAEALDSIRLQSFRAALALPAGDDGCAAWDKAAGECLLTYGEFNRRTGDCFPPPGWDSAENGAARNALIHSVRKELAVGQVRERYLLTKLRDPEIRERVDSALAKQADQTGLDPVLLKLYNSLHSRLFREREAPEFRILASTDSALIDSLHIALAKAPATSAARMRDGQRLPRMPWRVCAEACAQGLEAIVSDTLAPGRWTRPVRVPFGFAIVGMAARTRIPGLSFAEARTYLAALSQALSQLDSATAADADSRLATDPDRYGYGDTLLLDVRLAPALLSKSRSRRVDPDSGKLRMLRLTQFDLPATLRRSLLPGLRQGEWKRASGPEGEWAVRRVGVKIARTPDPAALARMRAKARRDLEQERFLRLDRDVRSFVARESMEERRGILLRLYGSQADGTGLEREKTTWLRADVAFNGMEN